MSKFSTRVLLQTGVLALLASFYLSFSTQALAQWKWRDKNNGVQYSDLPPPSSVPDNAILHRPQGASRRAATPTAPAAASSAIAASGAATTASGPVKTVDPELEAKRKKTEQEEAAKRKAEEDKVAAAKADNCTRAKSQMKTLEDGIRIVRTNAKGEREVLDDKGRAEEVARTREIMNTDCAK
jgi:type IV secretory pathway VirB10-like protein